ncbi:MAG: hypothetical protein Q8K68_00675, partial [Nitrospirota bacterium]|nr:hypothetical protein [Nitrospirota bacterium]
MFRAGVFSDNNEVLSEVFRRLELAGRFLLETLKGYKGMVHMTTELIFILIFIVFFLTVFTIDLFFTGRRKDKIAVKTALRWTAVWISTALIFGVMIYFYFPHGHEKAMEFLASYLIEYSLSVDNLFV